jgi:hypothetical protein
MPEIQGLFDRPHPACGLEFQNKLERYWNNDTRREPTDPKEKARISGPFL